MSHDPQPPDQPLLSLLFEREKELDSVYELADLLAGPPLDPEPLMAASASILRRAMQNPPKVLVHIESIESGTLRPEPDPSDHSYQVDEGYGSKIVRVLVEYRGWASGRTGQDRAAAIPPVLEREKHLVTSFARLLARSLERLEMDQALRDQAELLEQKNAALREILLHIEQEKQHLIREARIRISAFIEPFLQELKSRFSSGSDEHLRVEQIEKSIRGLFLDSVVPGGVRQLVEQLSPRELEICNLIRNGASSKEIAHILGLAESTVVRHRNTIRKKLRLTGKKIGLSSYLRSRG